MEEKELQKAAETAAFVEKEIARLLKEAGESGETVRLRNREYMAEHPFGSVYGDSDALVRENEKTLEGAEKQRAEARLLEQVRLAPYFGRVDFTYEDDGEREEIYVGLKTLVENRRFLVYDWRAPISSLFYFGELGRASYTAPCGEVAGEITRLRQYAFRNGALMNYWDAELHIDDAVLTAVLSGSAAAQMRPIVYTIQREQNAAIRYSPAKNLAVFGPAGCGKTAVGMHRLAWLLYQAHTAGKSIGTLMFTANAAFRSYVSSVLPALGEVDTEAVSFAALYERCLPEYRVQSVLQQTEALLGRDAFRTENVKRLYAPAFINVLAEGAAAPDVRFKSISILEEPVLDGREIARKFHALPAHVPVKKRLETVADWVCEELENYFLIHRRALLQTMLERTAPGESYTQQYFRLRGHVLSGARNMVLCAVPGDPAVLLRRFYLAHYGRDAFFTALCARLESRSLYYEDAAALLYIAARLGSCAVDAPAHVLIDEAQDYSALQHRTIRALYPKAVFSVLADPNQAIAPAADTVSAEEIASLYGAESLRISKSYRSTRPIGQFARRFLPAGAADYELFDRPGPEPEVLSAENAAEACARRINEQKETYGSAAVLLPTAAAAKAFYRALAPLVPGLGLVADERQALSARVNVLPAALCKGLEFDAVVVPVTAAQPLSARLLYLFSTRALHSLAFVCEPGTSL